MGEAVKKRDNITTYDRNISEMFKDKNTNDYEFAKLREEIKEIKESIGELKENKKNGKDSITLNRISIVGGILGILVVLFTAAFGVIIPINNHSKDIEFINGAIARLESADDNLHKEIVSLGNGIDDLSKFVYTNVGSGGSVSNSLQSEDATKLALAEDCRPGLNIEDDKPSLNNHFEKFVYAGEDEDGNKYNGDDLCGQTFITSYIDGENEVYFLGQYNENYRWYGECILNIYTNKKLSCIFEAVYNDGQLFSYRRVSDERDGTWEVADRIDRGDYRTGETWVYSKTIDYSQEISLDDYEESKMITYDDFVNSTQERLLSYYNGETSNGFYNDANGDAYLIKYFKDGEIKVEDGKNVIKTMYQGEFVNGDPEDEGYDAWEITRELNTTYMYYEGSFSNGVADNVHETTFQNNLDKKAIDAILAEKEFLEYSDEFLVDY